MPVQSSGAATVCSVIDKNKTYLCVENRHTEILPGQEQWWWYVDPQKGRFSPVVGAEDLGYTKNYACEIAYVYDAEISVAYPLPYPNYVVTSTKVRCDASLSVYGGGTDEGFGDPIDPVGDVLGIWSNGIAGSLCGGDQNVASVSRELSNVTIVCSNGLPSGAY